MSSRASKHARRNGREHGEIAPHSIEAEQNTLGRLLLGESWGEVSELLSPDSFYAPQHRLIYQAIAKLAADGAPIDPMTTARELEKLDHLKAAGGLAALSALARETVTANIESSARIVAEMASRRRLLQAAADSSGDLVSSLESELVRLKAGARTVSSLSVENVAQWADKPAPAPRDWVMEGLIPASRVTSFLGNGGLGKTTISAEIAAHVASNRGLWNVKISGGPVLGIFCEDERDELERRIRAACAAEYLGLAQLDRLHIAARDGSDNILCAFERDQIQLTDFYRRTEATIAELSPRLVIIDTAADVFAGDFMSTPHVRQFVKVALGGWCVRYGCAVLLVAHPSAAAMTSGDGGGFSTAWSNSVRSRLYLRRPKTEELEAAQDRRILEVRKSNYAADGLAIPLIWDRGCFVLDREPLEESAKAVRAPKLDTRLAVATVACFRDKAPTGQVLSLSIVSGHLQTSGALPPGNPEAIRKRVQRTLRQLESENIVASSKVPRGYRLASEAS